LSLRRAVALVIVVAVVVGGAGGYVLARLVVEDSLSSVEQSTARRNVDRATNAIANEVRQLDTTVKDWSSWDATYAYALDHNVAYEGENLPNETLQGLDLDFLLILDTEARPIAVRSIDRQTGAAQPLPDDLLPRLRLPVGVPPGAIDAFERSGVLELGRGPVLFAARPVLTGFDQGPARGYLVMGRFLDDALLSRVAEQVLLDLALVPVEAGQKAAFSTATGPENTLLACGPLATVDGPSSLLIQATFKRDIVSAGNRAAVWLLGLSVAASLGIGAAIFVVLEFVVIRRLRRLGSSLEGIAKAGTLQARVPEGGNDEVARLARDVNQVLGSLEASTGRYQTLVESSTDGIFLVEDGRVVFANEAGAALTGAPEPAALLGEAFAGMTGNAERETLLQALDTPEEELPASVDATFPGPGDSERETELTVMAVEGSPALRQVTARDVTERRQLEVRRALFERQMQEMQRMEVLALFAGGIAHDFNNILQAVSGNVALIRDDLAAGESPDHSLTAIDDAVARAADLTRQLLAYSGSGRVQVRAIPLPGLVAETVRLLNRVAAGGVTVHVELPIAPVCVEGDDVQLRQVVMNLLTNALDALEGRPGTVEVACGRRWFDEADLAGMLSNSGLTEGEHAFIRVKDSGAGIGAEMLRRIFEPFYSTRGAGRGLGLAAVAGIVHGHRGAVLVESSPGSGACFTVLLPPLDCAGHPPLADGAGTWVEHPLPAPAAGTPATGLRR